MSEEIDLNSSFTLLDLPEEILFHILSYIQPHLRRNISLVCWKFYEFICYLECDIFPLVISCQDINEYDSTYNSIMFSHRFFDNLIINFSGCSKSVYVERIENVIKKFGSRVKTMKLWCSVQGEVVGMSEWNLMRLIKCVPNLENLMLRNISFSNNFDHEKEMNSIIELDLHKLRFLGCDYCNFDTSQVFDKIPPNIIDDLVFTFEPMNERIFQTFFNRQSKIKKIVLFENDEIQLDHLQLEQIKISSDHDFALLLQQQPTLKSIDFAISWINDDIFKEVLKLKNLEVLRTLIDQVGCREFEKLSGGKLKELRIDSYDPGDRGYIQALTTMELNDLEKISLIFTERCIDPVNLINMSRRFRKLKTVHIINRSINILNTILEHYQQINSLLVDFYAIFDAPRDILCVPEDLPNHENLKELTITNIYLSQTENTEAILRLLRLCPNLEKIHLSKLVHISFEDMKNIFENHRNLTDVILNCEYNFNEDSCEFIKNAKKLRFLQIETLSTYPNKTILESHFHEKFPNITLNVYSEGGELIMRKRNATDWSSELKIMEHF